MQLFFMTGSTLINNIYFIITNYKHHIVQRKSNISFLYDLHLFPKIKTLCTLFRKEQNCILSNRFNEMLFYCTVISLYIINVTYQMHQNDSVLMQLIKCMIHNHFSTVLPQVGYK